MLDQLIGLKRQGYQIFDSVSTLQGLKRNTWRCHDWLTEPGIESALVKAARKFETTNFAN